ncbi:MAG: choice-of-anchor D domain-containing protein, partial [Cyanobacteria bacterium P01_H01_bin.130]
MTLVAGDIAFVAYNHFPIPGAGAEPIQFVTLVDIPGSEEIRFTDRGWRSPENDFLTSAGEGTVIWTAPAAGVPAGTVITINTNQNGAETGGAPGTLSAAGGDVINLSVTGAFGPNGDQIIAFQIAGSTTIPIAALDGYVFEATAVDVNTSAVPQGLTVGATALELGVVTQNNWFYNGPPLSGTKAEILALVNNVANWSNAVGLQTFTGGTVTVIPTPPTSEGSTTTPNAIAVITVTDPNGNAIADGGIDPIIFGLTPAGTAPTQTFTVRNSGDGPANLGDLRLPEEFSLVGTFPSEIAANSSFRFTLQFNPNRSGLQGGIVGFQIGGEFFNFNIEGTGELPVPSSIAPDGTNPALPDPTNGSEDTDDTLTGTSDSDAILGFSGNDAIDGGDGNDFLFGWAGEDTITGGAGDDFARGGSGNDVLVGDTTTASETGGNDTLIGGAGNDQLLGQKGDDLLSGEAGDDTLNGGMGNDLLFGGSGNDLIVGDLGDDTLIGNDGVDTF